MLGLKPVKLMPARERVASALRKAIISRQIKEGETLALEATAQELGVSITPVREAFQILARDGLLELKQNKGATVLGVTEKTLRDHYQIRAVLEGYACVLCVETGADLSALQNCLKVSEEMLASGDSSRYSDMNQSFHYEIWNASGNEKLVTMLSELWNGLSMGVQTTEMEYAKKSFVDRDRCKDHQQLRAAFHQLQGHCGEGRGDRESADGETYQEKPGGYADTVQRINIIYL